MQIFSTKVAPAAIPASMVTEKKGTVVEDKKGGADTKPVLKKRNKKLSSKQFSRAVLEDIDEVPLPEPEKKKGSRNTYHKVNNDDRYNGIMVSPRCRSHM